MEESWWTHAGAVPSMRYLLPAVVSAVGDPPGRVLDVGCGNGYIAGHLLARGFEITGIDGDRAGIAIARQTWPDGTFCVGNVENLAFVEEFDWVVSTEVVEHLYDPASYIDGCFRALRPGGRIVISTPYHGYAKNLALSLANSWDAHVDPLRVGGHIKMWSRKTLRRLLEEHGFDDIRFHGAGRLPYLWKSDVVVARRPN